MIAHLPQRARSIPRETEGAGRDLSASRASNVIDKECWYAEVRLWPFSTHAAMYADVGFRATAEVLEHHRDKWLTVTAGRAFNALFRRPERQPLAEPRA